MVGLERDKGRAGGAEQTSEKRPLEGEDSENTFKLDYFNISYICHHCEFFKLKR